MTNAAAADIPVTPLRADVTLSTGRTVTHRRLHNDSKEAVIKGDESSPMTDAEWSEFCEKIKERASIALNAAKLGKAAGEKFAKARIRMKAPVGRIAITVQAGRSHMSAWDHGKIKGAADVVPYCQAYVDAAFAALEPAGLVTL